MDIAALVRMVRLITHNLLACHAKGCNSNNFPLAFRKAQLQIREADMNVDFLKNFYPKLEWNALVETAKQLGDTSLPSEQPDVVNADDEFLKKLHHVLLEIHVEEGEMVCPNCQHVYPVSSGIPNMLLAEHEIA